LHKLNLLLPSLPTIVKDLVKYGNHDPQGLLSNLDTIHELLLANPAVLKLSGMRVSGCSLLGNMIGESCGT